MSFCRHSSTSGSGHIPLTRREPYLTPIELAARQEFISNAAIIIVGIGDLKRKKWYKVDLAIAFQQMILQATELGLGSLWIGAFDHDKIKELLKIPDRFEIVALLPIGISGQDPPARPRKPLDELFFSDFYGDSL